ncbi:MAG: hypothetical protein ACN6I7_00010 [bacterium]
MTTSRIRQDLHGPELRSEPARRHQLFGNEQPVLHVPMRMFDDFHEPGEKRLLNGQVVPAGQSA